MYNNKRLAGALLFVGSVQCLLGSIVAESLYPDYSVSENYISDLGVGTTSLIFNSSVFIVGLLAVGGAYFIQRAFGSRILSVLFAIAGVGAMGVGLFPETAGAIHGVASLIVFLFCHHVVQTSEAASLLLLCSAGSPVISGACSLWLQHRLGFGQGRNGTYDCLSCSALGC